MGDIISWAISHSPWRRIRPCTIAKFFFSTHFDFMAKGWSLHVLRLTHDGWKERVPVCYLSASHGTREEKLQYGVYTFITAVSQATRSFFPSLNSLRLNHSRMFWASDEYCCRKEWGDSVFGLYDQKCVRKKNTQWRRVVVCVRECEKWVR